MWSTGRPRSCEPLHYANEPCRARPVSGPYTVGTPLHRRSTSVYCIPSKRSECRVRVMPLHEPQETKYDVIFRRRESPSPPPVLSAIHSACLQMNPAFPPNYETKAMNDSAVIRKTVNQKRSRTSLLVLGMHRSGTSALTGALRFCGAWVGEDIELTKPAPENPRGFWERRDIRSICDRLLNAAGAEWWKVANFKLDSIPHAILEEQRRKLQAIVSTLGEHEIWVVKEPRFCLLLPILRDFLPDSVCINITRNPLEVARSLQVRNGFGIAAGLALWELYNRYLLHVTDHLPRAFVSYEKFVVDPEKTLETLLGQLDELGVTGLVKPDRIQLERFVSPFLHRHRATKDETLEYLTSTQNELWTLLCSNNMDNCDKSTSLSPLTRQLLLDLESTELSVQHYRGKLKDLVDAVAKRTATIEKRDGQLQRRNEQLQVLERRKMELADAVAKGTAHDREARRPASKTKRAAPSRGAKKDGAD